MLTSHQSQHISVSLPQPKSSKPPKYQSEDRKRISFPHLLNNIIMGFTSRSDNQQLSSAESIDDVLHNSAQDDLGLQDRQNQPPLNCPRCNSVNTKFCYYNNHNKSQPRHFCKACKRHWTAGGTLRDVPVGGNRRTKRLKTSGTSSSISTSAGLQQQQEQQYLFSIGNPNNSFLDSALPSPSLPTFTFTNLASFEDSILPFSFTDYTPFQPSESDEITRSIQGTPEDPSNTSSVNTSNTSEGVNPSWVMPSTGSFMESLSDWSFNDLNMLLSTSEFNQSWGDFQNEQRQL